MKICCQKFYVRFIITALLFCTCKATLLAQSLPQNEELIDKAQKFIHSNPDESIIIGKHLLKNTSLGSEKAILNVLVAEGYTIKGNYNNAIISVFEAGNYFKEIDDTLQIKILLLKSVLLRNLYLDLQSEKYLHEAGEISKKISLKKFQSLAQAKIALHKIEMNLERRKSQEAQVLIRKNNLLFKKLAVEDSDNNQAFNIVKAKTFSSLSQLDSATVYFNRALHFAQNRKQANVLEKAVILNGLSQVYFQKKAHEKSIALLMEALELVENNSNISVLKSVNRQLAINYLALGDRQNYQLYSNEFLKLNTSLEQSERESVNTAFNLISKEQDDYFIAQERKHIAYFYIVLGLSIAIILVCVLFWFKSLWKRNRLKEIINYLEISRNTFSKISIERKEPNKKIIIPHETEQAILAKLKRFEISTKFTNNEMSLAVLAGQFDTNTKYLSEIINKHYQDNFNTYINKLRINFIIEKLKTDPNYMHYKISYLAEKSGFSSHSSFATVFKSITGIAPGTFIDLLKEEAEQKDKEIA